MKKFFLTIVLVVASTAMYSQRPTGNGLLQLNAGLGFSSWGVPVYIGVDYGIYKNITVGGELSFRSYDDHWSGSDYHHSITGISANGNYHFNSLLNIPSQFDLYGGLNLGFYIWNSPEHYEGSHSSGLGLGCQVGGRYYFSDRFGVNLEFGGGNAFGAGKIGITLKL